MSNNTKDLLVEQVEVKRSFIQKYLQDPLSSALSKWATLFQATHSPSHPHVIQNDGSEQYDHFSEQNIYSCFPDRVDPSLYYAIFFPYNRY